MRRKLKEFYTSEDGRLSVGMIGSTFSRAVSSGVKEVEVTEEELGALLVYYSPKIPANVDVVGGKLKIWGTKIVKI